MDQYDTAFLQSPVEVVAVSKHYARIFDDDEYNSVLKLKTIKVLIDPIKEYTGKIVFFKYLCR